ncbi:MAG: dephospho-CoA kinase [Deltaproteobacteria bacterium]|nr:dephospho-CoA kinase [Deltaproteobacteria bacterium]
MLKVGLTGSIGSGKSTVARLFADRGFYLIDTDKIARQVAAPGSPGLAALTAAFGREILQADGSLDRARLGELIFSDEEQRRRLDEIMHPRIMAVVDERLAAYGRDHPDGIAIVDVPLLVEAGLFSRFPVIVLVYVTPEVQKQRLMARDQLTAAAAARKIAAQLPPAAKRQYADFIIDNCGSLAATARQVDEVAGRLRQLAAGRNPVRRPGPPVKKG